MSQLSPSASIVSLPTTENSAVSPSSSTATLLPAKGSQAELPTSAPKGASPPKNYEAAFAALSSSYGFSGTTPLKNPTKSDKDKKRKDKQTPSKSAPQSGSPQSPSK